MIVSIKRSLPFLLVLAFITVVPAGYAWENSGNSPLSLFGEGESPPASLQAPTAGAGPEPIVLAAARNIPAGTETPKPKKARKAKGPAPGSGCEGGTLKAGTGENIVIDSLCNVEVGNYNYGFVNIVEGGTLNFKDANIDFWTKSILVENKGSLIVGSFLNPIGKTVTFHLYGDDTQTAGITCQAKNCGVPDSYWRSDPPKNFKLKMPSGVTDYFYQYELLPADNATGQLAEGSYFGFKTLAVSYGGTLQMFGKKGAESHDSNPRDDDFSGESWVRLNKSVAASGTELVLDRKVDTWEEGDWIVVTTTDYIPNHSEMRQIDSVRTDGDHSVITLKTALDYPHNGEKYDLTKHNIPDRLNIDHEQNFMKDVDTRAAVALLTRNIRIVSEGAALNKPFPEPDDPGTGRYFGGHVIARQGFKTFQMRGVELKQLGQGGRMAHSPVNFHMARKLPAEGESNPAFVVACSVNESMTRMYEIRGTQGVSLKSNVGYKSIGHGYFLAEGTETDNLLEANIGIYARPAVDYRDNPRKVPGIFAKQIFYNYPADNMKPDPDKANFGAFGSDYIHPSVFYITNAYNTFEDNMAVGAGTCGACYWIAPAKISGLSKKQTWESYAGIQRKTSGAAPLYRFQGNFCSTAQYSLITIDSPGTCSGVQTPKGDVSDDHAFKPIKNPFELYYKGYSEDVTNRGLYPNLDTGSFLQATRCDNNQPTWPDCSDVQPPCIKGQTEKCAVNVIDSYTSSFHWAQQNYSAIWLRTNWFLFTNSSLTDVQNGGLTMVSGGSWDQVPNRYWAVTRKSVFIGQTQGDAVNIYAQNRGPVNPDTKGKLMCKASTPDSYCCVQNENGEDEGIVMPKDNFSVYQRLYNIYDGPVYQEANAYLNIKKREVEGCDEKSQLYPAGTCRSDTNFMYYNAKGIPRALEEPQKGKCYMPNAAIGWKQPNGFYYPPAFHSKNLFFDDVDLRHYVIVPLFKPGTYDGNETAVVRQYCTYPPPHVDQHGVPDNKTDEPAKLFVDVSWTDIDRQTELNDDDGSLSGFSGAHSQQDSQNGTVSVNRDQFYYAPKTPFECLSEQSCYQSPYDYVSAVVFPSQPWPTNWSTNADSKLCYGVPIYRQYLNEGEETGKEQGIRMLGAAIFQRSTMIANNGKYYIDTTVSTDTQKKQVKDDKGVPIANFLSEFRQNNTYNFFLIYAKPTTNVTFQLYVGHGLDVANDVKLIRVGNQQLDGKVLHAWAAADFITSDDKWPGGWSKQYDSVTGILEVTLDLGLNAFANDFAAAPEHSCGPPSFCQWKEGKCGCADPDPKFGCEDSICEWSSLRSECPENGCFGFQVKFPDGFAADDGKHRPAPKTFPASWYVEWQKADQEFSWDKTLASELEKLNPPGYDPAVFAAGPCHYSADNEVPGNAPLPSSGKTESTDD